MNRAQQIAAQLLEMDKRDFLKLADDAFGVKEQLYRVMGPPNDGGVFSVEAQLGDPGWGQFRIKPADDGHTFFVTLLVESGGGNQKVKLRTPADGMAFAEDIKGIVIAVKRGLHSRAAHLYDRMMEHAYASENAGKSYAEDHANTMKGTFTVGSSYGELEADTITGKVVRADIFDDEDEDAGGAWLSNIDRFDVKDYEKWQGHPIYPGDGVDILHIGGWTKDGEYWEPEHEARADSDASFEDE